MTPLFIGIIGGAAVGFAFVLASKHRRLYAFASGSTGTVLMCAASVFAALQG